jgi:hypothetical protein
MPTVAPLINDQLRDKERLGLINRSGFLYLLSSFLHAYVPKRARQLC